MTSKYLAIPLSIAMALGASSALWAASTDNGGPAAPAADAPAGVGAMIDFESDTAGAKPNGWQSVDSDVVTFTDSIGADLQVGNFGVQSDGQALGVFPDDQSFLIMDFALPMRAVSLDFGNDDPGFSNPGDEAEIRVFMGDTPMGSSQVVMNRNDIMDQTIEYAGECFDRAEFQYNVTTNGLIELVDNINFELCDTVDVLRVHVTKTFSDGSDDAVDVMISCNSGLPLEQTFTIEGGDPKGVTFVVTNIPESGADCEVTESGGPAGYTAELNGGAGCEWTDVTAGLFDCEITNTADDATYTVVKDWVQEGTGGDVINAVADVTISCNSEITGGTQVDDDEWELSGDLGDGQTLVAKVDVTTGPATCSASETIDQSGVESVSTGCGPVQLGAGGSQTCTFTNTVFFEGVPTLSQYGLAILVLLMLGVGFVGMRRFV